MEALFVPLGETLAAAEEISFGVDKQFGVGLVKA